MSDPPRLLDESASTLSRRLLASAEGDGPPNEAKQRVLLSLGLAAGAGAGAAAASTVGASGISAASGVSTASSLGKASIAVIVKWTLAGAALAGLTVTVAQQVLPTSSPERPAPIEASAPPQAGPRSPLAPHNLSAENAPSTETTPAPIAAVAAAGPTQSAVRIQLTPLAPLAPVAAMRRAEEPESPAREADLASEVSLLDQVREALSKGQIDSAMSALNEYERLPAKTLAPEATLLRIEVLARKGERAQAARLARAFLAAHPSSAHTSRVRTMLGALENSLAP